MLVSPPSSHRPEPPHRLLPGGLTGGALGGVLNGLVAPLSSIGCWSIRSCWWRSPLLMGPGPRETVRAGRSAPRQPARGPSAIQSTRRGPTLLGVLVWSAGRRGAGMTVASRGSARGRCSAGGCRRGAPRAGSSPSCVLLRRPDRGQHPRLARSEPDLLRQLPGRPGRCRLARARHHHHGTHSLDGSRDRRIPTTYYSRQGPLGDVFGSVAGPRRGGRRPRGGTVAAYGAPGAHVHVLRDRPGGRAHRRDLFTYLTDSEAMIRTVVGDGRLGLEADDDGTTTWWCSMRSAPTRFRSTC